MRFFGDLIRDFFSHTFYWITLVLLTIIGVFVITYMRENNAVDEDSYVYVVSADDILTEYKDNDVQASVKYSDEVIKITGIIDSINGDNNQIEIVLIDSILRYRVILIFTDKKEIKQISNLVPGDEITVVGVVTQFEKTILTNKVIIEKCNYIE